MQIVIDKDVPVPAPAPFKGRGNRRSIYPFMEMEVGDSVFFPHDAGSAEAASKDQRSQKRYDKHPAYMYAKKIAQRTGDRKFATKTVEGGIRIWRVA